MIRFAEPTNIFEETPARIVGVPILRSGYINSAVSIVCRVKSGNATPGLLPSDEGRDFITSPRPSRVTFSPNETEEGM